MWEELQDLPAGLETHIPVKGCVGIQEIKLTNLMML